MGKTSRRLQRVGIFAFCLFGIQPCDAPKTMPNTCDRQQGFSTGGVMKCIRMPFWPTWREMGVIFRASDDQCRHINVAEIYIENGNRSAFSGVRTAPPRAGLAKRTPDPARPRPELSKGRVTVL